MSFIYRITNKINGKIYIGKTLKSDPIIRFTKHKTEIKYGTHPNKHLASSFKKHGETAFRFDVLEECSKCDVDDREKYYIKVFKSFDPKYGFNKTMGGDGQVATEETRMKISKSNKGRIHSEKSRKNMSEAHKGQVAWNKGLVGIIKHTFSDEHRANLSKALSGKIPKCAGYNKGKKLSDDHRKKLSDAKRCKPLSLTGKKRPGFINSGTFKTGSIPWNKGKIGKKQSDETKKKRSMSLKGRVFSEAHKEKLRLAWVKRKKHDENRSDATPLR